MASGTDVNYVVADCTGVSGYSSLVASNFVIWPTEISMSCGNRDNGGNSTSHTWSGDNITKTYDASTGTLKIKTNYTEGCATFYFKKLKIYVVN